MSQERDLLQPELTLSKLCIQLVLSEFLQNQMKLFCILLFILGVDKNVIYEHYHELIQILHKHFVHQLHEIGQSISQSEDKTIYSYSPYRVMNIVLGMSLSRIFY
jgi:transposase